jgi:hypothetical protein
MSVINNYFYIFFRFYGNKLLFEESRIKFSKLIYKNKRSLWFSITYKIFCNFAILTNVKILTSNEKINNNILIRGSDFIAFANYYRIQIKIAEWAINLFYAPGTPNMKFHNAIFQVLMLFFANLHNITFYYVFS